MSAAELRLIRSQMIPLHKSVKYVASQYDTLLQAVGDARIVMIGEASHGTEEFYEHRAEITKFLIEKKGFSFVAAEADFPDTLRVTEYATGKGHDSNARESLAEFARFPKWMWRNDAMVQFVEWLRAYNMKQGQSVGFYGLDLYSLQASREAVIAYLERIDKEAAKRAKLAYQCFDESGSSHQRYGEAIEYGMQRSCENEVVRVLMEMNRRQAEWRQKQANGDPKHEAFFAALNALVVKDAESYYRNMYSGSYPLTWNLRDRHMVTMLAHMMEHFSPHNSHIGDARYTERGNSKVTIGQLVREQFGLDNTFSIGFTTYTGSVTAAHHWGGDHHLQHVNAGMKGSMENLFHNVNSTHPFMLLFRSNNPQVSINPQLRQLLAREMYQRAIGVIYKPKSEWVSHYLTAQLSRQFDCVLHFDHTRGVLPLDLHEEWKRQAIDLEETYPFGL